jgi:hypothetical protein
MGIIDKFLINGDSISKGFNRLRGNDKYLLVKDMKDNLICLFYDIDSSTVLVDKYLKIKKINKKSVKFETKVMKKSDEEFELLIKQKIVILDGRIVLYKDVERKANKFDIKGFNGKLPKYGINKYEVISKK